MEVVGALTYIDWVGAPTSNIWCHIQTFDVTLLLMKQVDITGPVSL